MVVGTIIRVYDIYGGVKTTKPPVVSCPNWRDGRLFKFVTLAVHQRSVLMGTLSSHLDSRLLGSRLLHGCAMHTLNRKPLRARPCFERLTAIEHSLSVLETTNPAASCTCKFLEDLSEGIRLRIN
jgi:hypothetical protein